MTISLQQFKEIYKQQISKSEKLVNMIKTIEDEQRVNQHSGMLLFDEFSYLYLFLDWTQDKEKKSKGKKGREVRGGEDEHGEGEVGRWC